MLFMAIVSTGSAESIAVASIAAYDIYRTYINPDATGNDIMRVSRYVVVGYGGCMGVLAIVLHQIGLNLGWVYLFMGIIIGSAVIPLWNLMTWKDASATGAILAAWSGMILALITWFIAASAMHGAITIGTLGDQYVMLAANVVAIGSSGCIHYIHSKMNPQNYDWQSMADIQLLDADNSGLSDEDLDPAKLEEAKAWIGRVGWGFTILIVVLWPVLSTPAGVFTKDYFSFWVFIAILWGITASFVIIVLPIYESRESIYMVCDGIFGTHLHAPMAQAEATKLVAEKEVEMSEEKA
mmetsp:Transcript_1476/g.3770  ORF Transcript_1476/g.3770 Transcript_1476/m.3770 type:complete len:296 (+) Transcript_1476:2-889(+)